MDRQLSIERRGELFHLSLHNYRGPWEGHQIEKILDLEEVEPPEDGEEYLRVLGPNQCYLWREMSFDPDLQALVTSDRLDALARLVQNWTVRVVAGEEYLPEIPESATLEEPELTAEEDTNYIEMLDRRHESIWSRGPRAVVGAALLRAVPIAVIVFALVIVGRHMGDKHESVTMDEVFGRAMQPQIEQSTWAGIVEPDYSHLVRNEIRSIRFANANRMIVGSGHYLQFEGVPDVMPWLTRAQRGRNPLVLDITVRNGTVHADMVRCGAEVLARNVVVTRVAKFRTGDPIPPRAGVSTGTQFQLSQPIAWDRLADKSVKQLQGKRISVEGWLKEEQGQRVFRAVGTDAGVLIETPRINDKLRQFLQVFTNDPAPVRLDLVIVETYPWHNRSDTTKQRDGTKIVGVGEVYNASAQNHHVIGRR